MGVNFGVEVVAVGLRFAPRLVGKWGKGRSEVVYVAKRLALQWRFCCALWHRRLWGD
jgi:hypothetical protein